jgi:hypothetical protein
MCYAPICSRCQQEHDHDKPHVHDADCLEALAKREYHAIQQHEAEMKQIREARARLTTH